RVRRPRPGPRLRPARPGPHRRAARRAVRRRRRRRRLAGRPLPEPPLVGDLDPRPLGRGRASHRPRHLTTRPPGGPVPLTAELAKTAPADVDALAVGAVKGGPVGGDIDQAFLEAQGFEGKKGEVRAVPGADGRTTYVVGLGPAD